MKEKIKKNEIFTYLGIIWNGNDSQNPNKWLSRWILFFGESKDTDPLEWTLGW